MAYKKALTLLTTSPGSSWVISPLMNRNGMHLFLGSLMLRPVMSNLHISEQWITCRCYYSGHTIRGQNFAETFFSMCRNMPLDSTKISRLYHNLRISLKTTHPRIQPLSLNPPTITLWKPIRTWIQGWKSNPSAKLHRLKDRNWPSIWLQVMSLLKIYKGHLSRFQPNHSKIPSSRTR